MFRTHFLTRLPDLMSVFLFLKLVYGHGKKLTVFFLLLFFFCFFLQFTPFKSFIDPLYECATYQNLFSFSATQSHFLIDKVDRMLCKEIQKQGPLYYIYTRQRFPKMNLFWTDEVHTSMNDTLSCNVMRKRRHE